MAQPCCIVMKRITQWTITLLLALALIARVWSEIQRDWLPPIDGPYQTINWCRRLLEGQVMGRDFPIFHGPGIVWYHLPFVAIFGGTVKGALAAYHGACALIIWIPVAISARMGGASRHQAAWLGLMMVGAFSCIPGPLYDSVTPAGNMLATRIALCLLAVMAFWLWKDRLSARSTFPWLAGISAGLTLSISQEQGISVGLAFASAALILARRAGSWRSQVANLGKGLAAMLATYLVLVTVFTFGHPLGYLRFAWQELPQNQFWFFGGPPRLFIGNWKDLLDVGLVVKPLAQVLLIWVPVIAVCLRRLRRIPVPILFLAAYSCFVLHPMAGYLSFHYFAAPTYAGLVAWAFLAPHLIVDFRKSLEKRFPGLSAPGLTAPILLTCGVALLGMQASKNLLRPIIGKQGPAAPVFAFQDHFSGEAQKPGGQPSLSATQAALEMTRLVKAEGGQPWSLFAGPVEEQLGLFQPSGFDYVFFAMNEESKARYLDSFRHSRMDCVILSRQSQSKDAQWLAKSYWELHHEILVNFEPSIAIGTQFLWSRRKSAVMEESREVHARLDSSPTKFVLHFTAELGSSSARLYVCRFRYTVASGPVPLLSRRLARLVVTAAGIRHWQNTGLPIPPPGKECLFDLPIIADSNGPVELQLELVSPFGAAPLMIDECSVRSLDGFDDVSLAAFVDDEWSYQLKSER